MLVRRRNTETNREGLTWKEWYAVATARARRSPNADQLAEMRHDWRNGVDPTEWPNRISGRVRNPDDCGALKVKVADLERRLAEAEHRVEHQGFKNYETFLVWVTIQNDQKYHDRIVGFARDAWKTATQESEAKTPKDLRADIEIRLSDVIEAWVEGYVEHLAENTRMPFVADLVRVGFGGVDFREIAAWFIDNVLEQDEYAWKQIGGQ